MNVLVVSAHHDDLELGCGGTVARLVEQGHRVISLVLTHSGYKNPAGQVIRDRTQDKATTSIRSSRTTTATRTPSISAWRRWRFRPAAASRESLALRSTGILAPSRSTRPRMWRSTNGTGGARWKRWLATRVNSRG